jgi:imidazolonepropionase-like amidohydrolase
VFSACYECDLDYLSNQLAFADRDRYNRGMLATLLVAKYTALLAGHAAGSLTVEVHGNERRIAYEYTDRGRGPKLQSTVTLSPRALPAKVTVTGRDYFQAPTNETWSGGEGFYLPMSSTPEHTAMLARALLLAPNHRVPIVGGGEASLRVVAEDKKSRMCEIVGLGLLPDYVWLDHKGELYAYGDPDYAFVIKKGSESEVDALAEQQRKQGAAYVARIAKELAHPVPPAGIAFVHANVLDVAGGKVRRDQTVVVSGDRIRAVAPNAPVPPGAQVIDAHGKTLMPGLWDMHTHIDETKGILMIAAGVTTVRDLGNGIETVRDLRERWSSGAAIGPRVIAAGLIDGPGPLAGPTKVLASTPDEARAAIDKYAKLGGYEQIKIYGQIKPELVPGMVAHAHELGLRVSGHVPFGMLAEDAVRAGFDEIQHINFLIMNFLPETPTTPSGMPRFMLMGEKSGTVDLSSAKVRDFVKLLHDRHTVVDPTLNVFESLLLARKGSIDPSHAKIADRLPPLMRRDLMSGNLPVPPEKDAQFRESFAAMKKLLKLLHDGGVAMVAGTDSLAGFALHRELELWHEAGIPTADILRAATLGAARVTKRDRDYGTVEPGKVADLLLVDGDPLARIDDVRKGELVIKGGTVLYRAGELYAAMGIKS